MKNLYEFAIGLYSECGKGMDLDSFIDDFMYGSLGVYSTHEAFLNDKFIGCFEMTYKIDHENRKIELLFEER